METKSEFKFLLCPRCGGKTRTQVKKNTVLKEFPLFCPKCKYVCEISFGNGKIENVKTPDAKTQC